MLVDLFDEYALAARVRPALLATLPIVLFVYLAFPELYTIVAGALSALVVFGLVTAMAHATRSRGRILEPKLFASWGGKPTTMLLRYADSTLEAQTKERYFRFLEQNIGGWSAPTPEAESDDPAAADQVYDSAARWLLEYTRDKKHFNLLFQENVSYGFRRNCLGIRPVALLLAITPFAIATAALFVPEFPSIDANVLSLISSAALSFALFLWWVFVVGEEWVKDAAFAYGIRLLAACENTART